MATAPATADDQQLESMLAAPDFSQDPYPAYDALRSLDPVHRSEAWGAWVFTGYEDIKAVLRDHASFSSADRLLELLDALPAELQPEAQPIREHYTTRGLVHADPPDHQRLRSLISAAFSTRAIERMRPRIVAIVDELLDAG